MEELDTLDREQLIQVIKWTLNDLNNAANSTNYSKLDKKVKGWCSMLEEAVLYQISKAHNANTKWYEEEE